MPETVDELVARLAWAEAEGLPVAVVGLGSNLLVADEGFPGVVLKLGGELARAEAVDGRLVAGGGAPLAVCLHRARAAELGGIEFVCAIPGTVGGGVWMNAGAYGGDIAAVLRRALVADASGARWRTPAELGLSYRSSGLRHGQVVASAELALEPRPLAEIKADGRGDAGAAQGGPADEQADLRKRLQEPEARADRGAHARGVRPARVRDRRRADLAEARQLHRERRGGALRRRDRADRRGAATARSSSSASCSQPEVQLLGALEIPPLDAKR